ncbi:MAG: hypothetical protein HF982_12945, partial [Desulfobacteraceae bacterium]|nr:hypothetical protein [Desulfobacteraceae bacterium]MBC2720466.1 hypothetical protein [Desulfobacteraceae bacterium]
MLERECVLTKLIIFGAILFWIMNIKTNLVWSHSPHDTVDTLAISPRYQLDKTVFCNLTHGNFFLLKSTNKGISWGPSQIGLPHFKMNFVAFSPSYEIDKVVFAGTRGGGVFKSIDGGVSWNSCNNGLTDLTVTSLSVSPSFVLDRT